MAGRQSEQYRQEALSGQSLVDALKLPDLAEALTGLGEMVTCLVEGAPDPLPVIPPPEGFRVRAWQEISQDKTKGTLHLKFDNPPTSAKRVEVAYEDLAQKVAPDDLIDHAAKFDLPASWREDPAPRFVTVYLREADPSATTRKGQPIEQPTTIIRIIPAPVGKAAAVDFEDDEAAAMADD